MLPAVALTISSTGGSPGATACTVNASAPQTRVPELGGADAGGSVRETSVPEMGGSELGGADFTGTELTGRVTNVTSSSVSSSSKTELEIGGSSTAMRIVWLTFSVRRKTVAMRSSAS